MSKMIFKNYLNNDAGISSLGNMYKMLSNIILSRLIKALKHHSIGLDLRGYILTPRTLASRMVGK